MISLNDCDGFGRDKPSATNSRSASRTNPSKGTDDVMDVPTRKFRTALSTSAAALAVVVPAIILATAGTAQATVRGLNVNFSPVPGGISVQVQDTVGAGKQTAHTIPRQKTGWGFPFTRTSSWG